MASGATESMYKLRDELLRVGHMAQTGDDAQRFGKAANASSRDQKINKHAVKVYDDVRVGDDGDVPWYRTAAREGR